MSFWREFSFENYNSHLLNFCLNFIRLRDVFILANLLIFLLFNSFKQFFLTHSFLVRPFSFVKHLLLFFNFLYSCFSFFYFLHSVDIGLFCFFASTKYFFTFFKYGEQSRCYVGVPMFIYTFAWVKVDGMRWGHQGGKCTNILRSSRHLSVK